MAGCPVRLTPTEFELLFELSVHAGVDVDPWRFHPHVTIGRLRRGPSAYMAGQIGYSWLDAWIPERGFDVHVTRITLFRSQLGPGGARYEPLFTAPMA